jgi:hypothetical protein
MDVLFPNRAYKDFFMCHPAGRKMTELKTKDSLLRALESASTRTPTAKEIEAQRVSFVVGSLGDKSPMTRERVQELLQKQKGL